MDRRLRGWTRPALVLGVLGVVAAALVASPVSAHFNPADEKKHVKKIARRIARKEAKTIVQTTVGPTLFIEEDELARWGPVELNVGAAAQTIGTFGPFTLKAECLDNNADPGIVDITMRIGIATSESNSALIPWYGSADNDFDTGEDGDWAERATSESPGDPQDITEMYDAYATATAPSGAAIRGFTTGLTNFSGSHCYYYGYVQLEGTA